VNVKIIDGTHVFVTLSKRNLETLTKMVTLNVGVPRLVRSCENGLGLVVDVEQNEYHYNGDPERKAPMGIGPEHVPPVRIVGSLLPLEPEGV
jgi:hypothetical protein